MRLADLPKYFSPKSIVLSDVRTVKAVDSLSVTDVMTSISLVTVSYTHLTLPTTSRV